MDKMGFARPLKKDKGVFETLENGHYGFLTLVEIGSIILFKLEGMKNGKQEVHRKGIESPASESIRAGCESKHRTFTVTKTSIDSETIFYIFSLIKTLIKIKQPLDCNCLIC